MKKNRLKFSIDILTKKSKIWQALWDENSYRAWASVFFEGSYIKVNDWEEGARVLFLNPNQSGIYSIIEKHIPNKIIQFKHIGNVIKGEEQPIDEATEIWSGATEVYSLMENINHITLTIELDVLDEHLDFMTTKLPVALEKIKQLSESSNA